MAELRQKNIAENWERAYDAFQQINFKAWDYNTIKESMLDYLKIYYPEDFNDYIESSELVAIIELFSYFGELLAYRIDLNTHENFLTTAERKESVLRLAKHVSYSASRNIPARGLVKITSITTTERVFDSNGVDLSNKTILWNDPDNPNWKEQFLLVMNRVTEQDFGTVLPSDRVQVQDVLFELYTLKNQPISRNVIQYNTSVSGETYDMELVSSELTTFGPKEKRPEKDMNINILYLQDGLGDASDNTGFFFLTKEGILQRHELFFDGVTPHQTYTVESSDRVNDTDVWLNNIDDVTNEILQGENFLEDVRLGEWEIVDVANAQNILFNTLPNKNKYEVETLDDDRFRIIFGDGNFADIPSGKFELWFRSSRTDGTVIPRTAIQDISGSFSYGDNDNNDQTLSFTFSLLNPMQNSAPSESIDRIRDVAPSVYYTQDRMVNGRDYNEFMLQDNTILKLRSINRTFAGDSKYIFWHDPKEYYENVKIFGDDGVIFFNTEEIEENVFSNDLPSSDGGMNVELINTLINNYVLPIIRSQDIFNRFILDGLAPNLVRQDLTLTEEENLRDSLQNSILSAPNTTYMTFQILEDQEDSFWQINTTTEPSDWWISLESQTDDSWVIKYNVKNLLVHSSETNFYVTNETDKVITYDTLRTNRDEIVLLSANVGTDSCSLEKNYRFFITRKEYFTVGENIGICNIKDLNILPEDENSDGRPDDVTLDYLIGEDDFVYFNREDLDSPWQFVPFSNEAVLEWQEDQNSGAGLWKRESGREDLNFLWLHRTPRYHLIDPAPSNIIDGFIITRGYYSNLRLWLNNQLDSEPQKPTSFQLRSDYGYLLDNKMISDTLILHSGKIKILFGNKARKELQASLKIVRSQNRSLSDNRIKELIVDAVNEFFDINVWNFGQSFYFTELSSFIHNRLPSDIDSVVLVPRHSSNVFGTLFQVLAEEDEIIQPNITVDDIEIVESLNPRTLKQRL